MEVMKEHETSEDLRERHRTLSQLLHLRVIANHEKNQKAEAEKRPGWSREEY